MVDREGIAQFDYEEACGNHTQRLKPKQRQRHQPQHRDQCGQDALLGEGKSKGQAADRYEHIDPDHQIGGQWQAHQERKNGQVDVNRNEHPAPPRALGVMGVGPGGDIGNRPRREVKKEQKRQHAPPDRKIGNPLASACLNSGGRSSPAKCYL